MQIGTVRFQPLSRTTLGASPTINGSAPADSASTLSDATDSVSFGSTEPAICSERPNFSATQSASVPSAVVSSSTLASLESQGLSIAAQQLGPHGVSLMPLSEAGRATPEQEKEILGQFDRWNAALQTGDPQQVTDLYATDAVLLPTVSDKVRHNHDEIKDYFDHFLQLDPVGRIDEHNVRVFGDVAINSGVYTFEVNSGEPVQARFTYVYSKSDGDWKIVEHHSSKMPEASGSASY